MTTIVPLQQYQRKRQNLIDARPSCKHNTWIKSEMVLCLKTQKMRDKERVIIRDQTLLIFETERTRADLDFFIHHYPSWTLPCFFSKILVDFIEICAWILHWLSSFKATENTMTNEETKRTEQKKRRNWRKTTIAHRWEITVYSRLIFFDHSRTCANEQENKRERETMTEKSS